MPLAVWLRVVYSELSAAETSLRISFSLISSVATRSVTPSICVSTFACRPSPSATNSLSRTQFGFPCASSPMMPMAHMATCSFVFSNQAWSSLSCAAPARPPRPPPPPPSLMASAITVATSRRTSSCLLDSVIVTFSGLWTLSLYRSSVMYSSIFVLNSGSGILQIRPSVSRSMSTPVASASSTPSTCTVTTGSACFSRRSFAHARRSASVSRLWSTSTLLITPYRFSFRLTYSPLMCRSSFPIG